MHRYSKSLLIVILFSFFSTLPALGFFDWDPNNITVTDPNAKVYAEFPDGDVELKTYRAPLSAIDSYSRLFNVQSGDIKDFPKAPDCTRAELHAIKRWMDDNYREVNAALRNLQNGKVGGKLLDPKLDSQIRMIASGINCLPQYKGQVIRTESTPAFILDQYQVGSYIVARGFTSTTKGTVVSHSMQLLKPTQKILIPQAQGGDIDITGISHWPDEHEVLIRPGTVFKVTSRENNSLEATFKNILGFLQF